MTDDESSRDPTDGTSVESGGDLRYRTVLWDIGGVIVDLSSVREGYATFVEELTREYDHDLEVDAEAALETWKSTLGDHFKGREGTDYRTAREGYAKATAALFEGDPPDEWEAVFARATEAALGPEDCAVEVVETLADAGVQQAVVSDIDTREAESMLDAFGIRERFEHVTTSEDVGYTKPDERMFRDALEVTGADPGRTLMVGDRHTHDVAGASSVGIDTAGYGEDARGPDADYEIDDLRELLDIVGIEGEIADS